MIRLTNPDDTALREAMQTMLSGVKSISALARDLGKSRGTIYKWQTGESVPTVLDLCQMALIVGVPLRIDLGPSEGFEETEDLAVMLGRVLANQERQIAMLTTVLGR